MVLCLFGLATWVREHSAWPTAASDNVLLIGILVLGLLPTELLLIDALIRRGGKLSFQGIEIDLAAAGPAPVDFRIDTNIGVTGEAVSDSSSARILDALKRAAKTDVVVLDLGDGKAWWETRLLVLVAGAVRLGKPRSVVFVTSASSRGRRFLGWATPKSLIDRLLDPSNPRHVTYRMAYALALDAGEKWQEEIDKLGSNPAASAPATPAGLTIAPWNWQFVAWDQGRANPFAPEQFLAAELGRKVEETWKANPPAAQHTSPTEKFPYAVTVTEEVLRSPSGLHVRRPAIEESAPRQDQVAAFLDDTSEYVAITHHGSYVRLALRSALLEGLVQQLLVESLRDNG